MKLQLPKTIGFPTAFPKGFDGATANAARAAARIEPGYVISTPSEPSPFTYYARCNVDNAGLWVAFETLVDALPDIVGTIIAPGGDEPTLLHYTRRIEVMRILRLYRDELARDPFLECGVIHSVNGRVEEVFIARAKYLRVWGNDLAGFRGRMANLQLYELTDLRFVDEFPLESTTLAHAEPGALHYIDVFDEIGSRINDLSPA